MEISNIKTIRLLLKYSTMGSNRSELESARVTLAAASALLDRSTHDLDDEIKLNLSLRPQDASRCAEFTSLFPEGWATRGNSSLHTSPAQASSKTSSVAIVEKPADEKKTHTFKSVAGQELEMLGGGAYAASIRGGGGWLNEELRLLEASDLAAEEEAVAVLKRQLEVF